MSDTGKTLFFWCLFLAAAGCAPVPKPFAIDPTPIPTVKSHAEVVPIKPEIPKLTFSEPGSSTPSLAERYLMELSEVQAMSVEQSRRELNELASGKQMDKPRRLRLAAVLAREEYAEWDRALKMLEGLTNDGDPRSQVLVDLLRKSWRLRLELRHQDARVTELQKRIQQIKTLEKDLQQRSETP